jgi:hypothetical protein
VRAERSLAALAAVACLALAPAAASGDDARLALAVSGGGLSATGPDRIDLPAVRLSGRPVTIEAPVGPFAVTDTRADVPGWSLVAHAEPPADAIGRPMAAALVLVPGEAPAGLGPAAIGGTARLDTPRALMRALPGRGTGVHAIRPRLRLTVPADTASGPYTTTLVVTVS